MPEITQKAQTLEPVLILNQATRTLSPCETEVTTSQAATKSHVSGAQLKKPLCAGTHPPSHSNITLLEAQKESEGTLPHGLHQQFNTINIQTKCQDIFFFNFLQNKWIRVVQKAHLSLYAGA